MCGCGNSGMGTYYYYSFNLVSYEIVCHHFPFLTLSYFRTYIYVRNPKTVATPVRIYTYTDFAIEIWGFTGV